MTLRGSLRPLTKCTLQLSVALLILPGCIPQAAPTSTPAAFSTVAVHVAPVPAAVPAAPSKIARTAITAPSSAKPYLFAKPHALPRILAINISSLEISSGDTVTGSVETTSNVASVEARIAGWSMSIPRTRVGHFETTGQVPDLTWIAKGTYTLEIIARNADGVKAQRDLAITLK